jgi:hypothetical protein
MNHRGRFQVQGKNLQYSNSWAQDLPLLATTGMHLLENLHGRLNTSDARIRSKGFASCRRFIVAARENGGINISQMGKPLIKSFPKNFSERLDLEVHSGAAFIKEY